MTTLVKFYLQILVPLPVLLLVGLYGSSWDFWILILIYIFYRMVTDANKLINSGAISKKDTWQLFTPFISVKYFKQLYFT
jgi:hypothetical protein